MSDDILDLFGGKYSQGRGKESKDSAPGYLSHNYSRSSSSSSTNNNKTSSSTAASGPRAAYGLDNAAPIELMNKVK